MPDASLSPYDEIAGLYHAMWADWYLPAALPALQNLFFSRLPPESRVLDLCCGSGHITQELVKRGHRVTGIDSSAALIELARRELPGVDLRVGDVRQLEMKDRFEGVLSTFDSLNHLLHFDELSRAFSGVHRVLNAGGLFAFDMNLEEAYTIDLRQWTVHVTEDNVGLVRGTYDTREKLGSTELIWFRRTEDNHWTQHRSIVNERCYAQQEILIGLAGAGFTNVEAMAAHDAGMQGDLGYGRSFFVARA
jgi:SAM-dependent methyltransferase